MKVWKRNAVVVAIVIFVGAAVYLNWSYNRQSAGEDSGKSDSGKLLGQSTLVSGTEEGGAAGAAGEAEQGQQEVKNLTGYFASARLNRQQARDSALELLQKAAADEKADQSVVDAANASIQAMAECTMSEAQVENLVTAKGYGDCVCFIGDDSASVVVSATESGLGETDIAKIMDIVCEETGLTASRIKVIEAEP